METVSKPFGEPSTATSIFLSITFLLSMSVLCSSLATETQRTLIHMICPCALRDAPEVRELHRSHAALSAFGGLAHEGRSELYPHLPAMPPSSASSADARFGGRFSSGFSFNRYTGEMLIIRSTDLLIPIYKF